MGSQSSVAVVDRFEPAEERLRALSELTSDFVYVAHVRDGTFENQWLSESFQHVFGIDYDGLRARKWTEWVHPDDHSLAGERLSALLSGREFTCEVRIRDVDGRWLWLRDQARPVMEGGRVVRIYGATRDVTEQRLSEQRLRESESRYRRLIERSPVPVVVHCDETFAFVNQRAVEAFGAASADELIGRSIWIAIPDDERPRIEERVRQIYKKDFDSQPAETRFQRLDGRILEVEVMSTMIDLDGRPAAEVVFQDVTERKQAERRVREQEERSRRAQKLESLGSLAAGIAHDFNNILVSVMGHADLALDCLEKESSDGSIAAGQHVEEVGRGAQHAADLAQQLLDYAGEKRSRLSSVDLGALVGDMDRLLRVSVNRRAELEMELAEELPAIQADATQMRQVVMNLVLNAADAIASRDAAAGPDTEATDTEATDTEATGSIRLRTYAFDCDDSHDAFPVSGFEDDFLPDASRLVVLDVEDDGCGMDQATRDRLFEPFYTTKPAGRGLGMATVLGILRAHHGAVSLDTAPGEGTRIRIAFPAASENPP